MQLQTVFKAGNSDVVAIPKYIESYFGIKAGQKVLVDKSPDGEGILIKKANGDLKPASAKVWTEFKKWLGMAMEEDKEVLDELALH